MQQKRINANYIDPEASAVMATNHLTETVEQEEAKAEELRLWFEHQRNYLNGERFTQTK